MVNKVRGMQDNYMESAERRQGVVARARSLFELYGYREIDTPVIEFTELFRRSTGEFTDIVTKEMYTFEDSKGRSLALRPEGTPTIVRAMVEDGLQNKYGLPLKFYYFGPMFRHERPQKGRLRQHTQMGVEVFGAAGVEADIEVMSLAYRLMVGAGVKDVSLLFNSIGCAACRPAYLGVLVDSLKKKQKDLCDNCRQRLENNPLRVLDCKNESCQTIIKEAPVIKNHLCDACAGNLREVEQGLGALEINCCLEDRLVRGLDYYTRTVFELRGGAMDPDLAQSALGGGGRYDNLVKELGGPDTPAVGFSSGLERVILSLPEAELDNTGGALGVFLVVLQKEHFERVTRLADELRGAGLKTIWDFSTSSLKKQLGRAGKSGAAHAVIIGPEEYAKQEAQLKDLASGEQEKVAWDRLVKRLEG